MRLFVCVMSCLRDQKNGCIDWFRQQDLPINYRIFLGNGCSATHSNEIVLPVDDSYERLAWKVQSAFQWALSSGDFTHILKTDSDCRIWINRIPTDFQTYDYVGNFFDGHVNPESRPETYASGAGYILSKIAAEKVINTDIAATIEPIHMHNFDKVYAEDMFVGKVVNPDYRRLHSEQFAPNFQGRNYNGPVDNLVVLGNVFDNKRTPASEKLEGLALWAEETKNRREGRI